MDQLYFPVGIKDTSVLTIMLSLIIIVLLKAEGRNQPSSFLPMFCFAVLYEQFSLLETSSLLEIQHPKSDVDNAIMLTFSSSLNSQEEK